jgi:predicted transposase YdaD
MGTDKDTQTADDTANREYKDTVFRALLRSDPKLLIEAYNAISGSHYGADTKVNIKTLDNVLCSGMRNDLAFELNGTFVVLIEHQSTLNDNMPLRMLFYIAEMYRRNLERGALYHKKPILLPRPEFTVLYNGVENMDEDCRILRLSDLYADSGKNSPIITPQGIRLGGLELEAPMYNINKDHNIEMLGQSPTLYGYSTFVAKSQEYLKTGMKRKDAIVTAIDYCIARNYISAFLEKHKPEVVNMLQLEWDLDTAIAVAMEEGMEEGMEKGERKKALEIANVLKNRGVDVNTIAEATGLTIDDILRL